MGSTVDATEMGSQEMVAFDSELDHAPSLGKPKALVMNLENSRQKPGLTLKESEWLDSHTPKDAARIYHKVDLRVLPILTFLYLIAQLDRNNIGNAKIEGLEDSLNMSGRNYNVAVMVFFPPYVLFEIPSNFFLSRFKRPSIHLGLMIICWGFVMTCTGFIQSYEALCVTRFLLGLFQAGFFPGSIWLISQWYPPCMVQLRIAYFFSASPLSGAFSGLLAAGIAQMDGLGGYEGWRWIFLIEGAVSVLAGIACLAMFPDSTSRARRWLSEDEIRFLNLTQRTTRGVRVPPSREDKRFKLRVLWAIFGEWQLYLQAIVYWSNSAPNYGLKFTMPQILTNLGFRSTIAQLLTAPPYICGAISTIALAAFADRVSWRMPFIVGPQVLLITGFSILTALSPDIGNNVGYCYFAIFLAMIGIFPVIPGCNAWTINNLAPAEKRAMAIAFMISMGNSGGIPGSFIFIEDESPEYPTGFGSSLGLAFAGLVACLILELFYWTHNRRYAHKTVEEIAEMYTDQELKELGNKNPLFKYSL